MVSLTPARSSSRASAPSPAQLGAGGAPATPPEQMGRGSRPGPAHPSPPSQGLQLEQGWDYLCHPPVCSTHRPLNPPGEQFTPGAKQCQCRDPLCAHSALLMARGQDTKGEPSILPHTGMGLTTSSSQQLPGAPQHEEGTSCTPSPTHSPACPTRLTGGGSAHHTAAPRALCDALLASCSFAVLCGWPRAGTPSSAAGCPPAATLYSAFGKREDSFPLSSSLFTQVKG